ncbi:hypothetical protein IW140_004703 [Coemansia sp. RSA 1813]|nr:hypothetical protein EV178_004732 [Coemansia sp. RSA 1646]KAJ1766925.1 hypothetical protein LPJ74_005626 [Coemansia sp. RSA 1843]KAJ2087696.1 hypothetical protein IW138_004817 [Coemansia sp. RSA 986]KAJ2212597.1 hypothetical protein EV179_004501 [Coemansia sp. RSA 487]KAJ2567061.1 hypothetical protein IW140_004703 [Coemansia sp. RSA 1813]
MGLLNYMVISTQALSSIFFIGATGYFSKLGASELQMLARINVSVFTPALLFSKISKSLDSEMLYDLWFVPILYLILGSAGLEWTRLGGRALGLTDAFRRLCSVAVYFSNVNTIMIPIIEGIAASPDSRFLLRDKNDTPQRMADRAIAYGMIIGIMNNLLRWSVGVAIMSPPKRNSSHVDTSSNARIVPTAVDSSESLTTLSSHPHTTPYSEGTAHNLRPSCDEQTCLLVGDAVQAESGIAVAASRQAVLTRIWNVVQPCLTPPLCAVVVALLVVLAPPLQEALLRQGSYAYCLWTAIDMCGQACIPATLLALGAQLAIKRKPRSQSSDDTSSIEEEHHVSEKEQNRGIMLVVLGRFAVVPACCCGILFAIHSFAPWLVPLLRTDPMLFLTLAIVSATPPAINLLTVAQSLKMYEGESARILSYSYVVGMLVLSVEVSVFLYLASLLSSNT